MKIALIILTKNEAVQIAAVIADVKLATSTLPHFADIYLMDDSSDNTAQIAESLGVTVLAGSGKGLGASYYKALRFFSEKSEYDLVISMDGDGQVDTSEIPCYLNALEADVDMVVGSRFRGQNLVGYNYPWLNYLGTKCLALFISFGAGQWFTDSHGGLRVMRQKTLQGIRFLGTHSYVQETIIDIASRGFRVREIPSRWQSRQHGVSRVVASRRKYAQRMLVPLLLRVNAHWPLVLIPAFFMYHRPLVVVVCIAAGFILDFYKEKRFFSIAGNVQEAR